MKNAKKSFMIWCVLMLLIAAAMPVQAANTAGWVKVGSVYKWKMENGNYYMKNGWQTLGGKRYYLNKDGSRKTGLFTYKGKTYYLGKDGIKVTNKYGIKIGKVYYKINSSGVCTKVSEVFGLAGIQLDKLGMGTDKAANLKKAFNYTAKKVKRCTVAAPKAGVNPVEYYALYTLKTKPGWGDCNAQAAVFYYMAQTLGYKDMTFVQGRVPQVNGTLGAHAWCEMKAKSLIYFFDPNAAAEGKTGYKFLYGAKNSYVYKDRHSHFVQTIR